MPVESPRKTATRDMSTPDDPTGGSKPDSPGGIKGKIAAIRAHPTGSVAFRTGIAILGGLIVVLGLALVPLPGPGWLIVFFGVSIWAIEFVWARHLLQYGRRKLGAWTAWVSLQPWPVKALIGAVGLVFVSFVVWLTLKLSFGVDLLSYL